jgi:hypothetical protein
VATDFTDTEDIVFSQRVIGEHDILGISGLGRSLQGVVHHIAGSGKNDSEKDGNIFFHIHRPLII